jgi:WD repeat-containing protein 55
MAVGVIATHEEYPIERIKLDRNGKWLGSVSHDDCIKLTDVEDLFEDSDGEGGDEDEEMDVDGDEEDDEEEEDEVEEDDSDSDVPEKKKKKKGTGKGGMGDMGRSTRNDDTTSFFDDL